VKEMSCEGCKWFQPFNHSDDDEGFCYRYPPVIDIGYVLDLGNDDAASEEGLAWAFPIVYGQGFCGEFSGK
jgi:hypothetical protein